MLRFYDPSDRKNLSRMEKKLGAAGIEYVVMPPLPESGLPGTIGIAEEDLPHAEELLSTTRTHTRH
jgi:hypothetical protein